MTTTNPFKPTAGRRPPLLVGRQPVLDDFTEGLDDGPGAPGRLMRVTGARGIGKTVILTEFGNIARKRGWTVVDETASKGLVERLIERIALDGDPDITLEAEATTPVFRAKITKGGKHDGVLSKTLRDTMSKRLTKLEKRNTGLLVTIDEAQAAARDDMVTIATAMQHMTREGHDFAFVFAGLPSMTSKWLNDDVMTFIRRAHPENLLDVPLPDVKQALESTFSDTGFHLSPTDLDRATEATGGYPYMIQLVGYHIWRIARRDNPSARTVFVSTSEVTTGIRNAMTRLGDTVHGPEMDDLSPVDRTYLLAMAQDDGPSLTSDVAKRLGKDSAYGNVYRNRLLQAQVIREVRHGYVDFSIPYLREYLREHDAYYRLPGKKPKNGKPRR